jgi:hypothetical protein
MRITGPLLLAVLTVAATAVAIESGAVADDPPKTKQQLKKELKQKLKAEAAKSDAAKPEAKPAEQTTKTAPAGPKPAPRDASAVDRLIDEEIGRKLAEAKVSPGPVCSDAEFLRRAYLDVTGVIPPADKARAFLDSTDPQKRAKLIDELLADPNYGRHQSDLWVPRLFPRDSANRFVLREPFVRWLEERFNDDTPWDKFVYDLVTASGTVEDNPAVTYFLANRSVDKLTDTVGQHFLGVQIQCAQCHNHPFNGWKQTEYWGMAAFFSHVQPQNPKNPKNGGDGTRIGVQETAARTRLKDFFPESAKTVPAKFLGGPEPKVRDGEPLRPVLAKWLTSPDNPYFARAMVNRTWAQCFGRGFVNPVDDLKDDADASHPELFAALTQQFVASGFDVKQLIRRICTSQAYQRSGKAVGGPDHDPALFARMAVKVMTPEQLFDSLSLVTGFAGEGRVAGPKGGAGRGQSSPRDRFVQFYLAGADQANPTEYEAGIPQALRLMNSRIAGNPQAVRAIVPAGAAPAKAFEAIYLAALSRRPTAAEVAQLNQYVAKVGNPNEAYADILWAVLNSSEFTMVR